MMTPAAPDVLRDLAQLLVRNADPRVDPTDRATALGLSAALLGLAAEAWDGAAHHLATENAEFRNLLARGASLTDSDLARRLAVLSEGADSDLRISALHRANAALRGGLVELHAAVEDAPGDAARDLSVDIFRALAASTERRRVPGSPV